MLRKLPITIRQEAAICQAARAGTPTKPTRGNDFLNARPRNEQRRVGGTSRRRSARGAWSGTNAKPDVNIRTHSQPCVSLQANAIVLPLYRLAASFLGYFGRISAAP